MEDQMERSRVHPITGTSDAFYWCLHCETAHSITKWIARRWQCPLPDCDGSAWDAREWSDFAEGRYPDEPEQGKVYPLYTPKPGRAA